MLVCPNEHITIQHKYLPESLEVCKYIAFPTMSQQLYQDYNRYLQFFVPS
jgi:hypothetical protein